MTINLRRLLLGVFFLDRRQDLDRAAGLLDRGNRRLRRAVNLDGELGLDLAAAEQPHAPLGAPDHAGLDQRFGIDCAARVDGLGVDCALQPVQVDFGELDPEDVGESALRQAPMQRHLAALESLDAHAGARGLALAAATRLLALAGADAAADAHALFARAGVVGDFAELHRILPSLFVMAKLVLTIYVFFEP